MFESWQYVASVSGLAILAYAATNIDNLLILTGLSLAGADSRAITRGFVTASIVILIVIVSFMALEYIVPPSALGYLGVIPIVVGTRMLLTSSQDQPELGESMTRTFDCGRIAGKQCRHGCYFRSRICRE